MAGNRRNCGFRLSVVVIDYKPIIPRALFKQSRRRMRMSGQGPQSEAGGLVDYKPGDLESRPKIWGSQRCNLLSLSNCRLTDPNLTKSAKKRTLFSSPERGI